MEIISNNPSRIAILAIIIFIFVAIAFLAGVSSAKKRQEDLDELSELIKERHQKIANYEIEKNREELRNEESITSNMWNAD